MKYSEELKEEILEKTGKGKSYRALAAEYGIPCSSISTWVRRKRIESGYIKVKEPSLKEEKANSITITYGSMELRFSDTISSTCLRTILSAFRGGDNNVL